MKLLTFLLNGPMQSWGDSSRWDKRSTSLLPTKSAIVGLLGCCLGYRRGDERLAEMSSVLRMAVRADRSGRVFWDFQTVQRIGGKLLNSEGKPRSETIITPKQYLQDCAFQVFLLGPEDMLQKCKEAMLTPVWPVFLGRRSCPPSRPILPTIIDFDSLEDAVKNYYDPKLEGRDERMTCQIEGKADGFARKIVRMDQVVRADLNVYAAREVSEITIRREGKE